MKSSKLILGSLILLVLCASCFKENANRTEEYIIKVDSIQVTDTVKVGDKIAIGFFGTIGTDGCSSFSRFILNSKSRTHTITVIGKRKIGNNLVCTQILPLLDGMSMKINADSMGTYKLEIVNPGINNVITRTVIVE
jgi:hypothetical protein